MSEWRESRDRENKCQKDVRRGRQKAGMSVREQEVTHACMGQILYAHKESVVI